MTAPNPSPYGNAQDWSTIIQGIGQGAGSAMQGLSQSAATRREAREAKRRTLANMLNSSLKRNQGLFRAGQGYSDEMNDFQSQALQQVARGFIDSMNGSTQ